MRGGAWCQEDSTGGGGGVGELPPWCMVGAPVHGMVRRWGGCPGETDGRRHPAPVSPPCDLVGACWQCRRPLPRLPSRPDPHSGRTTAVPLYGAHLISCLQGGRAVFCMSLCSMRAFDYLQLIIFTNHCSPIWKTEPVQKIEGGALIEVFASASHATATDIHSESDLLIKVRDESQYSYLYQSLSF